MVSWPSTSEPSIAGWTMSDVAVDRRSHEGLEIRGEQRAKIVLVSVGLNATNRGPEQPYGSASWPEILIGQTSATVREAGLGANVDGDEVMQYVPSASN